MNNMQTNVLTNNRSTGGSFNPRGGRRILLVEDSLESGELVKRICQNVDKELKLNWVKTAEEARRLLQSPERYDLIIADHFLEGEQTGLELWQDCRKNFKKIPFVMTSSLTIDEFLEQIDQNLGYPVFLHKPYNKRDCQQLIEWSLEELNVRNQQAARPSETGEGSVSDGLTKKLFYFLWVFGFLTTLLAPGSFRALTVFSADDGSLASLNSIRPTELSSIEKIDLTPPTSQQLIDTNDENFVPNLLVKMAKIDRSVDDINHLLNFNDQWPEEKPATATSPPKTSNEPPNGEEILDF